MINEREHDEDFISNEDFDASNPFNQEEKVEIEITVKKNGEVIGSRTALSWEGANEDFGKLERAYQNGYLK